MTQEEFTEKMEELKKKYGGDEEMAHAYMDDLLIKALRELGYSKGCDIYDSQDKWYA